MGCGKVKSRCDKSSRSGRLRVLCFPQSVVWQGRQARALVGETDLSEKEAVQFARCSIFCWCCQQSARYRRDTSDVSQTTGPVGEESSCTTGTEP